MSRFVGRVGCGVSEAGGGAMLCRKVLWMQGVGSRVASKWRKCCRRKIRNARTSEESRAVGG